MTKKQLKKYRQKQNKQAAAAQSNQPGEDSKPSNFSEMSDILFKQNEPASSELDLFKVDDLFAQPVLSQGLNRLLPPSFLNLTPRDIYEKIKEIASGKYGFDLPAEQKKLSCLQSVSNKTALLRDLCKVIGVQIGCDQKKKFLLGNKIKPIVAYINEQIQQE